MPPVRLGAEVMNPIRGSGGQSMVICVSGGFGRPLNRVQRRMSLSLQAGTRFITARSNPGDSGIDESLAFVVPNCDTELVFVKHGLSNDRAQTLVEKVVGRPAPPPRRTLLLPPKDSHQITLTLIAFTDDICISLGPCQFGNRHNEPGACLWRSGSQ